MKTLVPGDKIDVWGTYSNAVKTISINIRNANYENGGFLLRVVFYRDENKIVINSQFPNNGAWGTSIRCAFPAFVDGEEFKITVECGEDHYIIYFNDVPLEETFPYHEAISMGKILVLWETMYNDSGADSFSWDRVKLNGNPYSIIVFLL